MRAGGRRPRGLLPRAPCGRWPRVARAPGARAPARARRAPSAPWPSRRAASPRPAPCSSATPPASTIPSRAKASPSPCAAPSWRPRWRIAALQPNGIDGPPALRPRCATTPRATSSASTGCCSAIVAWPALANAVARRLTRRPDLADRLVGIAGDFVPARTALGPGSCMSLMQGVNGSTEIRSTRLAIGGCGQVGLPSYERVNGLARRREALRLPPGALRHLDQEQHLAVLRQRPELVGHRSPRSGRRPRAPPPSRAPPRRRGCAAFFSRSPRPLALSAAACRSAIARVEHSSIEAVEPLQPPTGSSCARPRCDEQRELPVGGRAARGSDTRFLRASTSISMSLM